MPTTAPSQRGRSSSAFSASLLLMASALLSGLLGLVRSKLIAHFFGAGHEVDAYTAAFELPDNIYYLLIGGVASTTFIKLLASFEAEGKDTEGDRALSNILNVMLTVLAAVAVLGMVFAPLYVRYKFHNFESPATAALCVRMTRILLVNPLLLLAGGVFGSRLLSRKIFTYQALQPLLYNGGIIAGALLLHARFGVTSLAIGAVAGAFVGFFLINWIGARSIGMRWVPAYDLCHPTLREWLRLSLPLMLGQSLVTLDPWIRSYFASEVAGAVALMNYSRQLFNAPMNMIGPAAGTASLPFFASLWAKGEREQFNASVSRAVSRLLAVSILLSSAMITLARPLVDVTLRGGRFSAADAAVTTQLFILFCLSLVFWASQNLYARAFYAAGNTLTPMISGTIVTVLSLPVYALLFHHHGVAGLVIASDIGIAMHMLALAVLLHRRNMVRLSGLDWKELGKATLAALLAGLAYYREQPGLTAHSTHLQNALRLLAGGAVWLAAVYAILRITQSALPNVILRRKAKAPVVDTAVPLTEAADAPDQ